MMLQIGDGFELSIEDSMIAQTIVGQRGAGKTNTAKRITEQLMHAGMQTVVLDPVGVWYGLQTSADGKHPGLLITVIGGEHGDLPLPERAGALLARLVVHDGLSCVIDTSNFDTEAAKQRLVTEFLDALYRLKNPDRYHTPVHVVLEEAEEFAPQAPQPGDARMLGACIRIVKRGRNRGILPTMVTQRPASLSKNVMNLSDRMVMMRVTGPQDRKALDEWVRDNASEEQRAVFRSTIAKLPMGSAFFWQPVTDLFEIVRVHKADTYDSGATPKLGEKRAPIAARATVDVEALRALMADELRRVERDDPALLHKRIRDLEARLRAAEAHVETQVERVEIPTFTPADRQVVDSFREASATVLVGLNAIGDSIHAALGTVTDRLALVNGHTAAPAAPPRPARVERQVVTLPRPPRPEPAVDHDAKLGKCERAILSVLAQYPEGRTMTQVAILAGYRQSGTFRNALGALRSAGLILGGNKDAMCITEGGYAAVGDVDALPRGADLQDWWLTQGGLVKAEREALRLLIESYPHARSAEWLAEHAGYGTPPSGTFRNALGKLRTLELATGPNSAVRASDVFFED